MFENPRILALLLLIPFFLIFFIWRGIVRTTAVRRIGDAELIRVLMSQVSPARRALKSLLWLGALAALIAGLARPTWGVETELVRTQGVQVVLALDVSRSMDAEDVAPSRLERMKLDMLDLVTQLEGNDIGIVLFAGEAFTYMPMTYDTKATEIFLESISTDMTTVQGTNVTAAIQVALGMFETRTTAQPVIVLISDGENHEEDPENVAKLAADSGVIMYTMGYGTIEGSPIPIYDDFGQLVNFKSDRNGTLITSRLDPEMLQRIASATGGFYQQVGRGDPITTIAESIATLQAGELRDKLVTRPIERFGVFVALAVFALSMEILMPETRRART
jgi:Ca-activated chloride channel family protein